MYYTDIYIIIMVITSRCNKKWTNEDDKTLLNLIEKKKDYEYIARQLGRTEDAIKARYVKIYIVPKHFNDDSEEEEDNDIEEFTDLVELYDIDEKDLERYLKYCHIDANEYFTEPVKFKFTDINEITEDIEENTMCLKKINIKVNMMMFLMFLYMCCNTYYIMLKTKNDYMNSIMKLIR
jgi:hypothetical protein